MIIYDNYTCLLLYPPKNCTNKPENQAFLKPYPWLPVFPTAPWQKATTVAIKSWLVAIELHWLRLKQHCWGWRYSPDPILHPSHNPPCRKFWGCQYREVFISLGWKPTLVIQVHCLKYHSSINYFHSSKRPSQSSICHPTTRPHGIKKTLQNEMSGDQNAGCYCRLDCGFWNSPMKLESSP